MSTKLGKNILLKFSETASLYLQKEEIRSKSKSFKRNKEISISKEYVS